VKGLTYQRLKKYCDEHDMTVSGFVEDLVAEKMKRLGVPEETVLQPRAARRETLGAYDGSSFTF